MFKESQDHASHFSASSATPIHSKAYNLDNAIEQAQDKLLSLQHTDGYWVFELEADCTMPAEYVMMMHFVGEIDEILQAKITVYLRSHQSEDGSFPLFTDGEGNLSSSVKVYYALKMAGDDINAPHMTK